MTIRPATIADAPALLAISRELIADGTTYAFGPETTDAELLGFWLQPKGHCHVAEDGDGRVLGVSLVRPNQPGRGSHVANAAYAVAAQAQGRGLGEALCRHSLDVARALGFTAMQFNIVVSTNTRAVALWQRLGFAIVGTLPGAFRHPHLGEVDAYVMFRRL